MEGLQLVLKRKYFDMIADGIKGEEYREITDYWLRRICALWDSYHKGHYCYYGCNCSFCYERKVQPKHRTVTFYCGYAKDRPSMTFAIDGVTVGYGKPELGAEPNKLYFVIKLGKRL